MLTVSTFIAVILGSLVAQGVPAPDVQALIDERVRARLSPGMAVGIVDREGSVELFVSGVRRYGDPTPIDADTVFEIGSISKVFTTLLLARLEAEGRLAGSDPVQKHLPSDVVMPLNEETPFTLEHLATHTSGLARMPLNFTPSDPEDPYADYTVEAMYAFLTRGPPPRAPGGVPEYSNLGMGLLGHVLALREETTYDALLNEHICRPLGMIDTRCTPEGALLERTASGHMGIKPVSAWSIPTMAGAGDINSTLRDMMRFAAANLDEGTSPLVESLRHCHAARVDASQPGMRIGLGWHLLFEGDDCIVWHNGMTGGFASFLGFNPELGKAVVVLANSNDPAVLPLGLHLLGGNPDPPGVFMIVDPGTLARYAGTYRMEGQESEFAITVENEQLVARLTGQESNPVYPVGPDTFQYRNAPATLVFEPDDRGRFNRLVLHQGGITLQFVRVASDLEK